jgi:mono/diheme cytochrome c family protein
MKSRAMMAALVAGTGVLMTGCHLDMWIQPKVKSQSESKFYADGKATRFAPQGTVEFGKTMSDSAFYTGFENGQLVKEMPVPVTAELIQRGKERYNAQCSHCHGQTGDGKGMIAQRGFNLRRPVGNYHTERLQNMPVGHFYDVITNGYGTMYPFASKLKPLDRWAVVAYIRTLQFRQNAKPGDLDDAAREKLEGVPAVAENSGPLFMNQPDPAAKPVPEANR